MKFPTQWPVSHQGGAAAPETSNPFFLKFFLHQNLPLSLLFTNPCFNFKKQHTEGIYLQKGDSD